MSFFSFQIYKFNGEFDVPDLQNQSDTDIILQELHQYAFTFHDSNSMQDNSTSTSSQFPPPYRAIKPFILTRKFKNLLEKFDDTILYQFICVPCAYCGRLMYPEKCEWICYDNNIQYPICQLTTDSSNPSMLLTFHPKHGTNKIAVCSSCKNPNNRSHFRPLHPIPNEIKAIPIQKRRFLSPIFMHCTLGRNSGDNIYTEYRILSGTMKFSKNFRSLTLYSGMEGAFLTDCD